MPALDGVKILELVHMPPGELCTMILGDMGADVVKVASFVPDEEPQREKHDPEALKALQSFNALNRNKRSIRLNLKSAQGKKVFHRLATDADVIVEGFRPGVAKRMGVDYDIISALNPRIVYCSLSGYGQDGPYSQYPGHDINYISIAGALNLIGWPGEPPAVPMNLLADFAGASMHGAVGILTALFSREKTGRGQYIDISYTDSIITLMTFVLQQHFAAGYNFPRGQWALAGGYPYYNTYQTKDGRLISLGCIEPWFWDNFCKAVGREDLKGFCFDFDHLAHGPQEGEWKKAEEDLKSLFLAKTRDEWFDFLVKADVPVGKVYSIDEIFSDPQLLHRRMLLEFDHPALGKVRQPGIAIKLSETPGQVRSLAPYPGQHTDEVLRSAGYTEADLQSLRKSKAIG